MTRAGQKRSGRRAGPHRTCIGCRRLRPQSELLRVVADPEGSIWPDHFGKLPGRGAHLCPNVVCMREAVQRRAFSRAFKRALQPVDADALAENFAVQARKQALAILVTALRSGFIEAGRDRVQQFLADQKKVPLVLVAEDASSGTQQQMRTMAERAGVIWRQALTKRELSALHRGKPLAVLSLRHRGMAKRLLDELDPLLSLEASIKTPESKSGPSARKPREGLTQKSLRGNMPRK